MLSVGLVTSVNVDTNQSDKLLRLLDTVVIKLEGGSDEDLKVLDEKPIEYRLEALKEQPAPAAVTVASKAPTAPATEPKTTDGEQANVENDEDGAAVKEVDSNQSNDANADDKPTNTDEKVSKKRKRTTSGSSSSSSSSTSSSGMPFRKYFNFFQFSDEIKMIFFLF